MRKRQEKKVTDCDKPATYILLVLVIQEEISYFVCLIYHLRVTFFFASSYFLINLETRANDISLNCETSPKSFRLALSN